MEAHKLKDQMASDAVRKFFNPGKPAPTPAADNRAGRRRRVRGKWKGREAGMPLVAHVGRVTVRLDR